MEKQEDGNYKIVEKAEGTWSNTHTETITISDEHSGLATGAQIQYGWSTSPEAEPSTWTTVEVTGYAAGDNSATIEVTESTLSGKYYLKVKPVTVKDTLGHSQTSTVTSANEYWFDSVLPTVTATVVEENITIIKTDSGSGFETATGRYYLSTNSTSLTDGTWEEYTSGNTITANINGTVYLFIEKVTDKAGNISTQYGTITTIDGIDYHRFGPYSMGDQIAPTITIGTGSETGNENENVVTADTLPVEDYGKYVTNYVPTNGVNDEGIKWRIFHTDGTNIYLIADTYVPVTNESGTKNYVPTGYDYTSGRYGFDLYGYESYKGTANIASNIASKWLKQYTNAGYTETSTNPNAKATAYLLDTNAWAGFKDSTYADYAVGAPTLELFTASYNKTHTSRTIETQVDSIGYDVAWSDGNFGNYYISGLDPSESLGLYVIRDTFDDALYAMWLASPSAYGSGNVMNVTYYGHVNNYHYSNKLLRYPTYSFSKIKCSIRSTG